jgi:hypothetical protein
MHLNDRKEAFSRAYVSALCSAVGSDSMVERFAKICHSLSGLVCI